VVDLPDGSVALVVSDGELCDDSVGLAYHLQMCGSPRGWFVVGDGQQEAWCASD
jgi:hypothetical protein